MIKINISSYADIDKNTKQENCETDVVSESELNRNAMKETSSEDAMVAMSPSYMSEASDAFGNSYQSLSQASVLFKFLYIKDQEFINMAK